MANFQSITNYSGSTGAAGVTGMAGTAGYKITLGWVATSDSFMPEWAKLIRDVCTVWWKAKLDTINPAEDQNYMLRANLYHSKEVQDVDQALLELERWWAMESLSNPSVNTFLHILAHWLSQDPNSPEISAQKLQSTLFMFQSKNGHISFALNDLLTRYVADRR
jgi:hypothetical protein